MPAGARPDIVTREALQSGVTAARRAAAEGGDLFSSIDNLLKTASRASGALATADTSEAAIATAEAAGEGLAETAGLPLTLALLGGLIFAERIKSIIRTVVGHVPLGVGGKLQALVDIQFWWLDPLYNLVIGQLEQQVAQAVSGFSTAVWWVITGGTGGIPNPSTDLIRSYVEPVHREVDHLWAWVQDVSERLDDTQAAVHGTPQPAPVAHVSLPERLSTLQAQIDALDHRVSGVQHELASVQAANAVQSEQIAHLQSVLYGARAASIGAQDVFHRLEVIEQGIAHTQAQQSTELQAHTSALAQLAPLMVLLPAGARGLENLVKLEENPCQCPALPRFGFQVPDLLGIEAFIANG